MSRKSEKSPSKNHQVTTSRTVHHYEQSTASATQSRSFAYSETRIENGIVSRNSSNSYTTSAQPLQLTSSLDARSPFHQVFNSPSYQSPYRNSGLDARPISSLSTQTSGYRPISSLQTPLTLGNASQSTTRYGPIASLQPSTTYRSTQPSSGYRPLTSLQKPSNNLRPLGSLSNTTNPTSAKSTTTTTTTSTSSSPSAWNTVSKIFSNPATKTVENLAIKEATKVFAKNKNEKGVKSGPGIAYIFNHETFDNNSNEERKGTQKDVEKLKRTFHGRFKMETNVYNNYKVKDISEQVHKMIKYDYSKKACIVIVILTHGTRHDIVSAKDNNYSLDDVILFPLLQNKTLINKPKILIVQACKGDNATEKYNFTDAKPTPLNPPIQIAKLYSTFEGFLSYRGEQGSLFIQILCQNLEKDGFQKTVIEIMENTIKQIVTEYNALQVPTITHNLTIPLIFGEYVK